MKARRTFAATAAVILIFIGTLHLFPAFVDQVFGRHVLILESVTARGVEEDVPPEPGTFNGASVPIPSVILKLASGLGLGNQLFQYAAAYTVARNLKLTLFLIVPGHGQQQNLLQSKPRRFAPNSREFAMDHFNLSPVYAKYLLPSTLVPFDNTVLFSDQSILRNKLPRDKILVSNDYFESELFFAPYKTEIMEQFQMRQVKSTFVQRLEEEIGSESQESVAVHVRRGDFARIGVYNRALPISYQIRAMELIESLLHDRKLKFFVFSDNINFVKRQFKELNVTSAHSVVYVSSNSTTSLEEFYLMTRCRHAIISNSTFSWWAAYLIQNMHKVIVAPFPRNRQRIHGLSVEFNKERVRSKQELEWKHVYPWSWITINPFESFKDMI